MKRVMTLAGALLFTGTLYADSTTFLGNRLDPYVTVDEVHVTAPVEPVRMPPQYGDRFDPYVDADQIELVPEREFPDDPYIWDRFDPYSGKVGYQVE